MDDQAATTSDTPVSSVIVDGGSSENLFSNDINNEQADLMAIAESGTTSNGATYTVNADGTFLYDPTTATEFAALTAGETIIDQLTYTFRGDDGNTSTAILSVSVSGMNASPPNAANDIYETDEDSILVTSTSTQPIHRYSFDGAGGNGAELTDSIGDAHGVLRSADDSRLEAGRLCLSGGSSDTAGYGDLPNGIISSLTDATIELWVTVEGVHNWMRLFDFGSTQPLDDPEIVDVGDTNGPGTAGRDYLFLSPVQGGNINLQRVGLRNSDPAAPGGGTTPVLDAERSLNAAQPVNIGQQYHWVVTIDDDGGFNGPLVSLYRDGEFVTSFTSDVHLNDINDVNNWLGRSNFTSDGNLEGSYDEFRIYDQVLSPAQVQSNYNSGSEVIPGLLVNDEDVDQPLSVVFGPRSLD